MTGRRASTQADRQRRTLDRLAIARRNAPSTGTSAGAALPMLAVLEVLESAGNLARLGRLAADPADDNRWRRVVVLVNALSQAVAADVKAGGSAETERLYRAITNYQQHRSLT